MHSNKSSSSPARSTSVVRDIVLFVNSDTVSPHRKDDIFFSRFRIWLEQISCMLLLPSHRRVPDFDTTNSGSNFNGPLVQFSVACSPDKPSLELSRYLHAQLSSFFTAEFDSVTGGGHGGDDDGDASQQQQQASTKHLVRISPNVACHRGLSGHEPKSGSGGDQQQKLLRQAEQEKKRRLSLSDIGNDTGSAASSRAGSVESTCSVQSSLTKGGATRLARVQTFGRRPSCLETPADAADRVTDFTFLLEACMDVTKISDPATEPQRDSDSDSSASDKDDHHREDDDGVSNRTLPMLGSSMTLRQVVVVVCNDFAFNTIAAKKQVTIPIVMTAEAFLWTRNTNQHRWTSPELWMDRTGATASMVQSPPGGEKKQMMTMQQKEEEEEENKSDKKIELAAEDEDDEHQTTVPVAAVPTAAAAAAVASNPLDTEMSMQFFEESQAIINNSAVVAAAPTHQQQEQNPSSSSNSNNNNNSILPDDEITFSLDDTSSAAAVAAANSHASPSPAAQRPRPQRADADAAAPVARDETGTRAASSSKQRAESLRAALEEIAHKEASVEQELQQIQQEETEKQQQQQQQGQQEQEGAPQQQQEKKGPRVVSISFTGPEKLSRAADVDMAVPAFSPGGRGGGAGGGYYCGAETPDPTAPTGVSTVLSSPPLEENKNKNHTSSSSNSSASRRSQQPQPTLTGFGVPEGAAPIPRYSAPLQRSLRGPPSSDPAAPAAAADALPNTARRMIRSNQVRTSSSQLQQQQQQNRTRSSSIGSNASTGSGAVMRFGHNSRSSSSSARGASTTTTNNKNGSAARQPKTIEQIREQSRALFHTEFAPRTGAAACKDLYHNAAVNAKRRAASEQRESARRREKEEEELRKMHAKHATVSMHNVGGSAARVAAKKIVSALRADPNSEEGLTLLPNAVDKIGPQEERQMMKRLVPEGPTVSKRFQNAYNNSNSARGGGGASASSRNSSANSRRSSSGSAPAWRHGGVATRPAVADSSCSLNSSRRSTPVSMNSRNSTPVINSARKRTASANSATSSNGGGGRTQSPAMLTKRLYDDYCKQATQSQAQRQLANDEREVAAIIEQRKIDNPTWAKDIRKDPTIEEHYRKRLLRARAEDRRLREQPKVGRNSAGAAAGSSQMPRFSAGRITAI